MRRLLLLVLAGLLLIGVTPIAALGESDLTALARYSGDDALMFASIRTDEGYTDTLDDLLNRVRLFLPAETLPPDLTFVDLIDMTLDAPTVSFEEDIRPWLGSSMAVTLFVPPDASLLLEEPDVLVAVDLADGDIALTFWQQFLDEEVANGDATVTQEGDATIYTSQTDGVFVFTADTLFVGNTLERVPLNGVANPLNNQPAFRDALAQLPEENYNIALYVAAEFQRYNLAASLDQPAEQLPPLLETLAKLNGAVTAGLTILGDDTLTLDVATQVNQTTLADIGLTSIVPSPIDEGLLARMPADSFAVLQGSDFGPTTQAGLENLRVLGDYLKNSGELAQLADPSGFGLNPLERALINQFDIAYVLGGLNLGFAGATGLSLENDVLPVLDGDAAVFARVQDVEDFFFPVLPGATVLFQTSDPDGAAAIVEQLGIAAESYDLMVQREAIGNGEALLLSADELAGMPVSSLDVLLGSSDDLAFIGTRNAIETVLADGGTRLTDTPEFQDASAHFLDGSTSMAYLAAWPMFNAVDALIKTGDIDANDINVQQIYTLLSIFESASITQTVDDAGVSVVRMVITLSDSPRPLPQAPDA